MLVGENIGRYEIAGMVGAGGMGEVYLAKDTQLGRDVALKILRPEFCLDEDRVKRFLYEARSVSGLNHPGIITIHEIVESGRHLFIATEFVDGETVRGKIESGSLDLRAAIVIAEQVADALAVAHEAQIIHRDVKPENIMVRKDGIVKILDFGLAKPLVASGEKSGDEHLLVETQPGLVIGSVRYMSPEQARGKETDGRTDIWSLGVVLYEMITGVTPFDGESISDQLAALIHSEPKPLEGITPRLDEIIRKCLRKDPSERYRRVTELASDLRMLRLEAERANGNSMNSDMTDTIALPRQNTTENATLIHRTISSDNTSAINTDTGNSTVESNRTGFRRRIPVLGAVGFAMILLAGLFSISAWLGDGSPSFDSIRVSRLTDNGNARSATISPDGKFLAFASVRESGTRLLVRQVATGTEVEVVPETKAMYAQPVFSPDGDFIYYVAIRNGVGTLSRVSALGGETKQILTDVDSRPAISPDGRSLAFFRHDPNRGGDKIFTVDSDGENQKLLTETSTLGVDKVFDLFWSADGKRVTVAGVKLGTEPTPPTRLQTIDAITRQTVDDPAISTFDLHKWVPAFGFQALEDGSGLIFVGKRSADEAMQVWHLDIGAERIKPVTTDTSDYEAVSASADGKTVVATKAEWTGGLISYDPVSKKEEQIRPDSNQAIGFKSLSVTADDQVLFSSRDGEEINIYVIDPTTGNERRLTSGSGYNLHAVSSNKDGTIVFASNRESSFGIWRMKRDGTDPVRLTKSDVAADVSPVLTNDDQTVVFMRKMNDGGLAKLMSVPIDGGDVTEVLPGSSTSNMAPRVSRDGKTLAFLAVEFDEKVAALAAEIMVADVTGEGFELRDKSIPIDYEEWFSWSPNGKSLTRMRNTSGSDLWDVPLEGGPEKQLTSLTSGRINGFAWSADGSKLYMVRGVTRSDLVLIRNETGE
ncbi:MAG: protein kinase [Acidobacteriota bacterium]|nr:protein kinase [Acidobacteriota bacterium]